MCALGSSWTRFSSTAAGSAKRLEEEYDVPLRSTTYLSWWAFKPSQIVERFKAKLRRILLEATNQ